MMLENYSPDNYWNARYDRLGADWQPLSTALAERYGLEALLDPNDLARVRDTLGWDRQIFARALLDLLWLTLARWEPRRDGCLLLQLDLPPEQQPDVAIRIMDFWDNVL